METRQSNRISSRNKRKPTTDKPTTSGTKIKKKQPTPLSSIRKKQGTTAGQSKSSYFDRNNNKKNSNKLSEKSNDTKQLKDSKTFEKYGVVLPKFKDVLDDIKKTDKYEESVKHFLENIDMNQRYDLRKTKTTRKSTEKILDCKHLTKQQINEYFNKYKTTLSDILDGRKRCQRHDLYYKDNKNTLVYNTSMIVFSTEQKLQMLDLMHQTFDSNNEKLISYFLKVLLPELCLFIFMDTHRMSKKEAEKYLADRPVNSS